MIIYCAAPVQYVEEYRQPEVIEEGAKMIAEGLHGKDGYTPEKIIWAMKRGWMRDDVIELIAQNPRGIEVLNIVECTLVKEREHVKRVHGDYWDGIDVEGNLYADVKKV